MAKKKVEVSLDRSPMRDTPLTGDVEITYDGSTIYATSETNQIHLLTENKVCLDDITVDYTKPEPETVTIPVYYSINNGENVYTGDITNIAGASLQYGFDLPNGQYDNSVNVTWIGSGPFADYRGLAFIATGFGLTPVTLALYMPNMIPENKTGLLVNITTTR